jgi:hypothetical protein
MTRDWLLTLLVLVSPFLFVLAALIVALALTALHHLSRPRRVAVRRLEPDSAGAAVDVASGPMGRL